MAPDILAFKIRGEMIGRPFKGRWRRLGRALWANRSRSLGRAGPMQVCTPRGKWSISGPDRRPSRRSGYRTPLTACSPDIRVTGCDEVPLEFHARFDAIAKQYVYRIDNRPFPSPLLRHFTYFVARPLDVEAMRQGGAFLVGRHDFRAFAGSAHGERSTVRTLTSAAASMNTAG